MDPQYSLEKGLKDEEDFFREKEPWCYVTQARRGIPQLTNALSLLLAQRIEERYGFCL